MCSLTIECVLLLQRRHRAQGAVPRRVFVCIPSSFFLFCCLHPVIFFGVSMTAAIAAMTAVIARTMRGHCAYDARLGAWVLTTEGVLEWPDEVRTGR